MARTSAGANDGRGRRPVRVATAALLLLEALTMVTVLTTAPLRAQEARQNGAPASTAPADATCPYVRRAPGITPARSGLDVVRGADGGRAIAAPSA